MPAKKQLMLWSFLAIEKDVYLSLDTSELILNPDEILLGDPYRLNQILHQPLKQRNKNLPNKEKLKYQ